MKTCFADSTSRRHRLNQVTYFTATIININNRYISVTYHTCNPIKIKEINRTIVLCKSLLGTVTLRYTPCLYTGVMCISAQGDIVKRL